MVDAPSPPRTARQRLTPEVAVVRDAAGGRPLRVETSFPPQGWTPRRIGHVHVATHPGTGLLDGEHWYEIVEAREDGPLLAWRTITQPQKTFRPPSTRPSEIAHLRDTVRPWPGEDADLEVRSRLPKEHWLLNVGGVIYEGHTYVPVAREVLQEEDEPYRFLLKLPEHETLFRSVHEYHPEEAREIERERRRAKTATWVETFSFLWGLVDGNRQARLERTYKVKLSSMTNLALGGMILFAVVNLVISVQMMRSGGGVLHALMFFFNIYLLWETALRWGDVSAGRPVRASVLGAPLRGIVDRALRWER